MNARQPIDAFSSKLDQEVKDAVRSSSRVGTDKRAAVLAQDYADPDALRALAAGIKRHTLENLDTYLPQAAARIEANGAKVHFAEDAESARAIILSILQEARAKLVTKSKSMASEEIELNAHLAEHGIRTLETDLGEFIVQIDHDHPSHIVKPIIHKNRRQIARSFEREGLGAYDDDPATITRRARQHMRGQYLAANATMTGANFVSAESGRLVLVTNEGNSRFGMAGAKLHIALVGIEKIVPRDRDLAVFLNLLARSATAQQLTSYTEFVGGPRPADKPEGPARMHVVFLDNGRSRILGSEYREILHCIRCGACMNTCPVYREVSGHAYRSTYPGPLGSVISPLLSEDFASKADLPKACTLCGACGEVCPVMIPLPELLLRLRNRAKMEKIPSPGTPPMGAWASLASTPFAWRASLSGGAMIDIVPHSWVPVPAFRSWKQYHELPAWRGGKFRKWMASRPKK